MTNNWPANEPDSLEDLCVQACVNHVNETLAVQSSQQNYELKPGVCILVPSICDKLFKQLVEAQPSYSRDWSWIGLFADTEKTRLCKVQFPPELTINNVVECALNHPLKQLDIDGTFLHDLFTAINSSTARHSLLSFSLQGQNYVDDVLRRHFRSFHLQPGDTIPDIKLDLPQLQRLVIRDVKSHDLGLLPGGEILHLVPQLTHLDLSGCELSSRALKALTYGHNLLWLNLHCVKFDSHVDFIDSICKVQKLRHLDISSDAGVFQAFYTDEALVLKTLLDNLPYLVSLDISYTNLAGKDTCPTRKSFKTEPKGAGDYKEKEECGIPGLEGRMFEFLGLYNCPYESYRRENIPAKQITGCKNEEQLLLALHRYQDRKDDINDILNHLFVLFKEEFVINQSSALEGILAAMKRHKEERHIQISGSASLFYIMKGEQKSHITQKQKRTLINCLLDGMEDPQAEQVMIRNCCLTMCHLSMPQDVLYCYQRVIAILLRLNRKDDQDEFIQRITLYMINHLACQVDGEEKKVVGDLGAITLMLETVENKLKLTQCDEIMEMAWSTMWNVTDETAINCDRFMDENGMSLFIRCLIKFPEKPELLRNMMGLMGNIAEVPHLRPRLMEKSFIEIFCDLLDSGKDGIEVSYNSAGVFSHMMADGPEAWTVDSPSRDYVTGKIIDAIQRWPLKSKRNINYRSFGPILKLVNAYHAVGAQYWAVWALCNLTTVYTKKYCPLFKSEGGVERINEILNCDRTDPRIVELGHKILHNVTKLTDRQDSNNDSDSDGDGVD